MQLRFVLSCFLAVVAVLVTGLNLFVGHQQTSTATTTAQSEGVVLLNTFRGNITSSFAMNRLNQVNSAGQRRQQLPRRPSLDSIIQGKWNITGDASWLLDFSIIGFPKCGTSTLMFHLLNHPDVLTFKDERCEISYNQQAKLIRDLYHLPVKIDAVDGSAIKRGIKCPIDLENTKLAMPNYQKYFPKTNYVVGIRHPVS